MTDDRYDDRSEARYEETDTDRWSEDVLEARWGADPQPWDEPERNP